MAIIPWHQVRRVDVEHAIRNRTPCTIDLNLTDEQYQKLSGSSP